MADRVPAHVNARVIQGSALDAVVNGPVCRKFGFTKRLHDVVSRYDLMLRANPHGIPVEALAEIALGLEAKFAPASIPWPTYNGSWLRDLLAEFAPGIWEGVVKYSLGAGELVSLLEDVEEYLATQRPERKMAGE